MKSDGSGLDLSGFFIMGLNFFCEGINEINEIPSKAYCH